MIIDTSAVLAILKDEPECPALLAAISSAESPPQMSAATYVELFLVVENAGDPAVAGRVERLLRELGIELADVTGRQAEIARAAHRSFGRGNHPAKLNFGECFSYALAKDRNAPLLFTGADFARTDVRRALPA